VSAKSRKEQIEELLAQDPSDPFLRYGLAMEYVSAGDDESAVRSLRELAAASPNYVPAYQQLGQALVRLGRPADARAAFEKGIAAATADGNAHAAEEMRGFLASLG
jgi:predicted Zn-dependent protease